MNKRLIALMVMFVVITGAIFAQDLTIDYRFNTRRADANNYLTFTGPIRYMAVEQDRVDASTGASALGSTHFFQPYRVDVLGKNVLPDTLRGLFLYAVNPIDAAESDNLTVSESRGVITVQFSHRGTAYRIVTDSQGRVVLPNAQAQRRTIGYISGHDPQVISTDFSRNGSADRIDWNKVWDSSIAGGTQVADGVDRVTGDIGPDLAAPDSMFYWQGTLQFAFRNNILTISGGLNAVAR